VTALIAWPTFHSWVKRQVANQMAAPGNENAQRAPSKTDSLLESADGSMATVATRREKNLVEQEHQRIHLTPTGLLMEGVNTF